jgi:uncharacterized membrane-anchored protein
MKEGYESIAIIGWAAQPYYDKQKKVLHWAKEIKNYADGNKYADFNPDIDDVAAWTIGGLVAGKVLAKAGIFALLLKNIKLIALAIGGLGTAAWRWYKKKTEVPAVRNIENS